MKNKENIIYLFIILVLTFATIFFAVRSKTSEVKYNYTETSKAEYSVCLKENDLFTETCLGEEKQYVSALSNEIRATLYYERINTQKRDTKFDYYVTSKVLINNASNDKEIFNEVKELTTKKEYKAKQDVDTIQDTVVIKFDDYNEMVNEQLKKYSLTAKASVQLSLIIVEDKNERVVSSITIPLAEQTYSISKNVLENNLEVDNTEKKNNIFVSVLFGVLDLIAVAILVIRILKGNKVTEFESKINQILTEYDKIIVEVKNDDLDLKDKQIITVNNFGELVDVRDNIEKPILYIFKNDKTRDFIVQDKDIVYMYTMCDINNDERSIKNE